MLDLLTAILQHFWDLIPRPVIIGPTERAVRFLLGRSDRFLGYPCSRTLSPGLYIQWPLLEEFHVYTIVSQVVETAVLVCCDSEGITWQVRLVVEYEIPDPLKAHLTQASVESQVEKAAGAVLVRHLETLSSSEISHKGARKISRVVRRRVGEQLANRGIHVLAVDPVMFSRCRSFFVSQAERLVE